MNTAKDMGIKAINSGTSTGQQWLDEEPSDNIDSFSPADGAKISSVQYTTQEQYNRVVETAAKAFLYWREVPPPVRGDIVRQIGNKLREYKESLGMLVSYEMGKIYAEGMG